MGLFLDGTNSKIYNDAYTVYKQSNSLLYGVNPIICANSKILVSEFLHDFGTNYTVSHPQLIEISWQYDTGLLVTFLQDVAIQDLPTITMSFQCYSKGSAIYYDFEGSLSGYSIDTNTWQCELTVTQLTRTDTQPFDYAQNKGRTVINSDLSYTMVGPDSLIDCTLKSLTGTVYYQSYNYESPKSISLSQVDIAPHSFRIQYGYNTLEASLYTNGSTITLRDFSNLNGEGADHYFTSINITNIQLNITYIADASETKTTKVWSDLNYYNTEDIITIVLNNDTKINGFLTVIGEVK